MVNPIVVVWHKDNYYLVCYDDKHDGTANYRIDRIAEAQEEKTERTYRKELNEFDVEKYRQKVFSMFGGEEQDTELQFDSSMLDDIFDRFGEDVHIVRVNDNIYRIKTQFMICQKHLRFVLNLNKSIEPMLKVIFYFEIYKAQRSLMSALYYMGY